MNIDDKVTESHYNDIQSLCFKLSTVPNAQFEFKSELFATTPHQLDHLDFSFFPFQFQPLNDPSPDLLTLYP